MNSLKKIGIILRGGCIIFTIITLFAYTLGTLLSTADRSFIPSFKWIWLFFLFSVLLSASNRVFTADKLKPALRLLIHFASSAALFYVVVVLCGGFYKSGNSTLVAMAAFCAVYIIGAIFALVYMQKRKKTAKSREKYESVFR